MSLAQEITPKLTSRTRPLLDWNDLKIAVLELHLANRPVWTQRPQGFAVGANRQTAGISGAQHG